jgi:hypothetical protein
MFHPRAAHILVTIAITLASATACDTVSAPSSNDFVTIADQVSVYPSGTTVANAHMSIGTNLGGYSFTPEASATTDGDGRYTLTAPRKAHVVIVDGTIVGNITDPTTGMRGDLYVGSRQCS